MVVVAMPNSRNDGSWKNGGLSGQNARRSENAVETLVALLVDSNKDRLQRLAMEWPSLAAALGDVLYAYDRQIPGPLRHARNTLAAEGKT
jgi:hypothetical protein